MWKNVTRLTSILLIFGLLGSAVEAKTKKDPLRPQRVASFQQLKQLISSKTAPIDYSLLKTDVMLTTAIAGTTSAPEFSSTNVQVQGVDEGDIVKTDGQFIYTVQGGQVRIVQAYPPGQMKLVSSINISSDFTPIELYVQKDRLVVIGQAWRAYDNNGNHGATTASGKMASLGIWMPGDSITMARVYNISDRTLPSLEREVSFSGSYLSSRLLENNLYLIGRKYPNYFMIGRPMGIVDDAAVGGKIKNPALTRSNLLPHVQDSAVKGGKEQLLPVKRIYYFPGFVEPDYVILAGFSLNEPDQAADIKSYLGAGDLVYASTQHLYLSAADYNSGTGSDQESSIPVTHIYKFALNNGSTVFRQVGEVPGVPLNQFSMDEYQDHFRIATTVHQWSFDGTTSQYNSWNNLYTLNSSMKLAGRLEHLAEGERIYAARFMGEKAYLVTFVQTDPLFVIDLSTPTEPKLLGELKIPGFSNYLHPFDENHIFGIGQDVEPNNEGGAPRTKGVKLSLFDVSNPTQPVELHTLTIGDYGTYTPAQYDHKAVLFDAKRGLLGFPIQETAKNEGAPADAWPEQVFQGAQVFGVSLDKGFEKKAAITHLDQDQPYQWHRYVQRLLTIDDQLYTLSESRLQANDLTKFKATGQVDFPFEEPPIFLYSPATSAVPEDSAYRYGH
jgi:uncharacterized secreted protein with C-terminal beta-propeller domain